jgi:hypothetical protein
MGKKDEKDFEGQCSEAKLAGRELRAAYLWMKSRKDELEDRKYTESIILVVTREGRIIGCTEAAAQLVKKQVGDLQGAFINDFVEISDGQPFSDLVALVRPQMPFVADMTLVSSYRVIQKYQCKITNIALSGESQFFLVFYPETAR